MGIMDAFKKIGRTVKTEAKHRTKVASERIKAKRKVRLLKAREKPFEDYYREQSLADIREKSRVREEAKFETWKRKEEYREKRRAYKARRRASGRSLREPYGDLFGDLLGVGSGGDIGDILGSQGELPYDPYLNPKPKRGKKKRSKR